MLAEFGVNCGNEACPARCRGAFEIRTGSPIELFQFESDDLGIA
jgi:hypothetical protein